MNPQSRYNSFLSIVLVVHDEEEAQKLPLLLERLFAPVRDHFADFEFIVVNNLPGRSLDELVEPLTDDLKHQVYVLNLSSTTPWNHAVVAGLDRANGDYTLIFEFDFMDHPELVVELMERARQGYDIVYLRAPRRVAGWRTGLGYRLFYWILKNYSSLQIDELAHNTRLISRRALNSLLRLRENLRYMKAIYSIVGYRTTFIQTEVPLKPDPHSSFREKLHNSLVAITSFTTFLRTLLFWIFVFSILLLIVVIYNAVKVKLTNVDIFGIYHETVSGWPFLVVLISVFFAITCLNLFIMSIYLSNIYYEIKHRPLYLIESIKRY